MFVVFDVMAIFLYAWGSSLLELPKSATFTYDGLFSYNVWCNGICIISIRGEEYGSFLCKQYLRG